MDDTLENFIKTIDKAVADLETVRQTLIKMAKELKGEDAES